MHSISVNYLPSIWLTSVVLACVMVLACPSCLSSWLIGRSSRGCSSGAGCWSLVAYAACCSASCAYANVARVVATNFFASSELKPIFFSLQPPELWLASEQYLQWMTTPCLDSLGPFFPWTSCGCFLLDFGGRPTFFSYTGGFTSGPFTFSHSYLSLQGYMLNPYAFLKASTE